MAKVGKVDRFRIVECEIRELKCGDCVLVDGGFRTVSDGDVKLDTFMGDTLFGDSYRLGMVKVKKVIFTDAKEIVSCPECGFECMDFTPDSEFIGWNGRCARCEITENEATRIADA